MTLAANLQALLRDAVPLPPDARFQTRAAESAAGNDPLEFVMSDDTIDRMGDVIDQAGWQLAHFRRSPVALFNHDRNQVIGRWRDVAVRGGRLTGFLELADEGTSSLVDSIRKLVAQKILRAVSVGFRALGKEKLTEKSDEYFGPFRFTKAELLECSLVSVPANPHALAVAKGMPPEICSIVFGEHAAPHASRSSASMPKPLVQKSTTMQLQTGTLAQKINVAHTTLTALRDRLAEIAGKDNPTHEEEQQGDELPGEIEKAEAHLERLERQERALAGRTIGGAPTRTEPAQPEVKQGEIIVPERRGAIAFAAPKQKIEPADYMFRALACWHGSQALREPLDKVLQDKYRNDEFTGAVLRAAVNPAQTSVATWAAELTSTVNVGFLDRLIPNFIYPALAAAGARYTFGNNMTLRIPTRTTTNTVNGSWVGEGSPKPVRRASFALVTLTPFKLAVISTFTEEMALYSVPAIEGIIRQAMSDDTGIALDGYLIDATAASATRPAGLLNGVSAITASAAATRAERIVADLSALVTAIIAAGGGRSIVFLMNPAQVMSLGISQTTTGDFLFGDSAAAASKFGGRIISSLTVPEGRVIAIDAADFATATGDAPRFAVSTEATLHEEDTTPLAIGTAGTPNVVAAPVRSLFQTDAVAIRMVLYITWAMRRTGMVQTIANVDW
jgi:HK97 family phage prohead protease